MGVAPSHAVDLAQRLIRCPSVTPHEGGALDLLQAELAGMGFVCTRLPFGEGEDRIDNLFARFGTDGPHLAFAGHTDVVPIGDAADWTHGAFDADIADGRLYGRGAADMKGGIAAFVGAVARLLDKGPPNGSISLLITGDEEGDAVNGTVKMVDWVAANGQRRMRASGEPTNPAALALIKNGRRAACRHLTVTGRRGMLPIRILRTTR